MFPANPLILPAAKANLEAHLALLNALSQVVLRQSEKICESNLTATRSRWERSATSAKELLAIEDPQERWALLSTQATDNMTAFLSYGREMANILSSSHSEITKELETQGAETRRQLATVMEQFTPKTQGAPDTGAWMTSAMSSMQNGYEQWTNAVRQSVSSMDKQLLAVAEQTSQAAKRNVGTAARK